MIQAVSIVPKRTVRLAQNFLQASSHRRAPCASKTSTGRRNAPWSIDRCSSCLEDSRTRFSRNRTRVPSAGASGSGSVVDEHARSPVRDQRRERAVLGHVIRRDEHERVLTTWRRGSGGKLTYSRLRSVVAALHERRLPRPGNNDNRDGTWNERWSVPSDSA